MAQIGTLNTFVDDVDEVVAQTLQYNYTEISGKINSHMAATTDVHGIVSPDIIISKQDIDVLIEKHYPIGRIIFCWEGTYLEEGLSKSEYYKEFNGQTITNLNSLYCNKVLPDLDQCFFIGVETCTTIAGSIISSNTFSFNHRHLHAHKHQLASHSHTSSHRHLVTDYAYVHVNFRNDGQIFVYKSGGTTYDPTDSYLKSNTGTDGEVQAMTQGLKVMGLTNFTSLTTSTASASDTNDSTGNTSWDLPTTQDIRPKYIKMKAYLRII